MKMYMKPELEIAHLNPTVGIMQQASINIDVDKPIGDGDQAVKPEFDLDGIF